MISSSVRDPRKVYTERIIFMSALLIPAAFLMGLRVVLVSAVVVATSLITDRLCCALRRIEYDRGDSAVHFWALSAAMLMPASISLWLAVFAGAAIAAFGKHVFGASDNIVCPPSAAVIAFMIICWPGEMLFFPKAGEIYPLFDDYPGTLTRSLDYTMKLGMTPSDSIMDILMGRVPGAIGAVSIMVILVCGVCLLARRSNSIGAVISCLIMAGVLSFLFPRTDVSGAMSIFYEFSTGYFLFGVFFIASEPYLLPKRVSARVIYGAVLGYTIMMFRHFGKTEGSFLFAVLVVSMLSPGFDILVDNLSYWKKTYINSFEKNRTEVNQGSVKLTDTQEIVLPEKYRYNTPPVDGEVKKHRRRRRKEDGDGK